MTESFYSKLAGCRHAVAVVFVSLMQFFGAPLVRYFSSELSLRICEELIGARILPGTILQ